ncbi:AzlC family ABC transporter permease [Oceanospirillum beijerinckii]|uniref:AzlC family ABC transporter permease n=1 Tax=Oceanospirillum beijerinckii TaxID=64976 RepID=UPI0004107D63|nr:AzlC family ABC transporter permease [Oceanospirillum beijerinckii]
MQFCTYRAQYWQGTRDLLPLVSGVLPFGLIAGANGVALGMNPETIMGMTLLFFAGSAQLAAYQLIQEGAPFVIILVTSVVVNLRFAIYSATFAPLLAPLKKHQRWPIAYLLSDQVYGLCAIPDQMAKSDGERLWYLIGVATSMWLSWILSVIGGVALGASIPAAWSLEFTIPLAFLAMLVATITRPVMLLVSTVSGVCAVLFQLLPYNSGFIVAVVTGVIAGLLLPNFLLTRALSSNKLKQNKSEQTKTQTQEDN